MLWELNSEFSSQNDGFVQIVQMVQTVQIVNGLNSLNVLNGLNNCVLHLLGCGAP